MCSGMSLCEFGACATCDVASKYFDEHWVFSSVCSVMAFGAIRVFFLFRRVKSLRMGLGLALRAFRAGTACDVDSEYFDEHWCSHLCRSSWRLVLFWPSPKPFAKIGGNRP